MAFQTIRPGPPPCKCGCGSNWFREVSFAKLPEWPWPEPLDCYTKSPIDVLVCLCGQLIPPVLPPGFLERGPRTPASLVLNYLQRAEECSPALALAHFKSQVAVERAQLPVLEERVRKLELAIKQRLAEQPVTVGQLHNLGRAQLVRELQKVGINYRKARKAVEAVFLVIQEGLRNEWSVRTPIGELYLNINKPPREDDRRRKEILPKQRLRVVFKLNPDLLDGETKKTNKKGQNHA